MKEIEKFRDYLIERRGLDPTTAEKYCSHVQLAEEQGLFSRLKSSLAPNTLHLCKSSLKAYANFSKDNDLLEKLKDFRLPPAGRVKEKKPLTKPEWQTIREGIDASESISDVAKSVLSLMALRGFRVGDVCRMTKPDIVDGLRSGQLSFKAKRAKRLVWTVTREIRPYLESIAENKDWSTVADLVAPGSAIENRQKAAILSIERALKVVAEEVGLDPREIHPHRLRRTVATYFLEKAGGDLTKLKAYFGWANITTASLYADYHERGKLDEIAESMYE